jgi:hypothetical protein
MLPIYGGRGGPPHRRSRCAPYIHAELKGRGGDAEKEGGLLFFLTPSPLPLFPLIFCNLGFCCPQALLSYRTERLSGVMHDCVCLQVHKLHWETKWAKATREAYASFLVRRTHPTFLAWGVRTFPSATWEREEMKNLQSKTENRKPKTGLFTIHYPLSTIH